MEGHPFPSNRTPSLNVSFYVLIASKSSFFLLPGSRFSTSITFQGLFSSLAFLRHPWKDGSLLPRKELSVPSFGPEFFCPSNYCLHTTKYFSDLSLFFSAFFVLGHDRVPLPNFTFSLRPMFPFFEILPFFLTACDRPE